MGLLLSADHATLALPTSVSLEPVGDSMLISGLKPLILFPLSVHDS